MRDSDGRRLRLKAIHCVGRFRNVQYMPRSGLRLMHWGQCAWGFGWEVPSEEDAELFPGIRDLVVFRLGPLDFNFYRRDRA